MAANDDHLNRLTGRLDVMDRVVRLSNLTNDDLCILQQCHQSLRSIERLETEMQSLAKVHEEAKRKVSDRQKELGPLLSLAEYLNGAVAKAVDDAKPPQPALPAPKTRHADACGTVDHAGIAHVTDREFGHLPQYTKGRQCIEALNRCVDHFNKALADKYELLSRPKAELRGSQKTRVNAFKRQESQETRGVRFVTESELTVEGGPLKNAKAVSNFVVIMRHCGRLREVRGQDIVRYAVQ